VIAFDEQRKSIPVRERVGMKYREKFEKTSWRGGRVFENEGAL